MRISHLIVAAVLALMPGPAGAQGPGAQSTTPGGTAQDAVAQPVTSQTGTTSGRAEEATTTGWVGFLDFGLRGTHVDGDASRFERYRDLGDGLFLEDAQLYREAKGWLFGFDGAHVGRRDQRFVGSAVDPGKYHVSFTWDQIPMLLSRTTRTLFSGVGTGTLAIDDALQAQVQATPSAIAAVFAQSGQHFETRTRRHIAEGAIQYSATDALTLTTSVRHTDRQGTIPFGGSFGHTSLVEFPAPTQHTLSDVDAGAEYVRGPMLLRAGYMGSWFHNDVTSVTFDNPFRAMDTLATSSRGRLTLPPSNSFVAVNGMASVKLPYRSRVTAYASTGMLQDVGDTLVPQTINSAIVSAPADRQTVNGEARTSSLNVRFTSRPTRLTDVTVSVRSYEYDNRTPEFTLSQRVAYDNTPAVLASPIHTEPYSVGRSTFDADVRLTPKGQTSVGLEYTRAGEDRTHRIFESTTDNVLRLSVDTMSRQWISVRTTYEHAERRGEGIARGEELLASIGEQPKLRHFDVANRDRDRLTVIGTVTPTQFLTTSLTFAAGKDDYIESLFGLRDNTHRVYGAGADYLPHDLVSVGVSYSFEEDNALQRSRQANPGVQFGDSSRNWAADSSDRTHSVLLSADASRIGGKVDLRLSYDFSQGRARYNYITGPVPDRTLPEEVPVSTTLPTPTELPPTLSEFRRGTVDVSYALTNRVSVGMSYWYDQFRVTDFTLDVDANSELARGQALLMGYLYRPYTANTGWVRLLYRW